VLIEVWGDMKGKTIGDFVYVIDDYEPRDEKNYPHVTGFNKIHLCSVRNPSVTQLALNSFYG
jgi:hypothetical protein